MVPDKGLLVAVAAALSAAVGVSSGASTELPLSGETKTGQRWRLEATERNRENRGLSWCLTLRYTTGVVIDGDPFAGGLRACGPPRPPRISGEVVVDCARGSVFIFGGARTRVGEIRLVTLKGRPVAARRASLPPGSRMGGTSFVIVADARRLPARLRAEGSGQRDVVRVPSRTRICRPVPGAPEGGTPLASFRSRR